MTRASMVERARSLTRPELAGIGRFRVGDRNVDFRIGYQENERDAAWAASQLRRWGIDSASFVMVTAAGWQGPWVSPVVTAFRRIGATFGVGDVFGWDARRLATFARRLPLSMVFGLTGETAAALDGTGQLAELLGKIPALMAYPDALDTLAGAGLRPATIVYAGPALGIECPERAGAHVNAAEWRIEEAGGELVVSTVAARAWTADREPTGLTGTVVTEPCRCGSADPRVRLG